MSSKPMPGWRRRKLNPLPPIPPDKQRILDRIKAKEIREGNELLRRLRDTLDY